MVIPNSRTRNFSLHEVIHCPVEEFDINLLGIAYTAMGYMQKTRDDLERGLGYEVYVTITSGYRNPGRNRNANGSASNSFHGWRYIEGVMAFANDFKVFKKSDNSDVTIQAFDYLRQIPRYQGELYYKRSVGIIHQSSNGKDNDAPWIQD